MQKIKHVLQWHILHRCNLRCSHCYQEDYGAELSFDELKRIFFQYKNFCTSLGFCGHINFTGGEPIISRHLFPLLDLCSEHNITFGILTNGTLITDEIAGKLGKYSGLSFVQISIDGTEKTHDSVRGNGNFRKAFEGADNLRAHGIQTMAAFTCHKRNYTELKDVIKTVRRKKIDRFWADRLIPMGSSTEDILTTDEYREVIRTLTHEHNRRTLLGNTNVHLNRALQFLEGGDCFYQCTAGTTLLTVLADGTLLPCRRLPIPIGNCLETDMLELYRNSSLIAQLKEKRIPDECIACPKAEACRGGAKCLSYAVKGDHNIRDINCYKLF